jgi:hypothetical protein
MDRPELMRELYLQAASIVQSSQGFSKRCSADGQGTRTELSDFYYFRTAVSPVIKPDFACAGNENFLCRDGPAKVGQNRSRHSRLGPYSNRDLSCHRTGLRLRRERKVPLHRPPGESRAKTITETKSETCWKREIRDFRAQSARLPT